EFPDSGTVNRVGGRSLQPHMQLTSSIASTMRCWAILLLALIGLVNAQTRTITTEGATVVVDVTTTVNGNGDAVTTTSIIRTLGGDDGPFAGQPPDTNQPAQPTYYWVTSYDANGNSVVNSYLFSPTFAPSSAAVQYTQGTIYDYDSWTAQFATQTVVPSSASPGTSKESVLALSMSLCAIVTGMFFVLL
ncbi:5824_t:CDS:2, partial [Acaulospora colombiana]